MRILKFQSTQGINFPFCGLPVTTGEEYRTDGRPAIQPAARWLLFRQRLNEHEIQKAREIRSMKKLFLLSSENHRHRRWFSEEGNSNNACFLTF
jgi:hypothetical protein